MTKVSRGVIALVALFAFGTLAGADAQKPTPPTLPKAPTKPISTLKAPAAPATGGVILICKDFDFTKMATAPLYRGDQITYETITVKDTSGVARTIYAPTRIVVTHEFKPAAVSIGSDGRGLESGLCGTPNATISGTTGAALLQFTNFPSVTVQSGKKTTNDMSVQVSVTLPLCASGLRSFRTMRQSANEFVVASIADVACLR